MSEDEYAKLIAKNISYYMNLNQKSQVDLCRDLHLNKATVSKGLNAFLIVSPSNKNPIKQAYFGICVIH